MLSFLLATLLATSTFSAAQSGDASTGASFTYPPEDGLTANENTHNFTQNLVFYENQQYVVEWINVTNPDNTLLNLAVWHVFPNQSTIGDLEYVSQNMSAGTTNMPWIASTNKNLTDSPMFQFALYLVGEFDSVAESHYINISVSAAPPASTASSTTSSASTASPASITTSSSSPTSTSSIPTNAPSPSLSTGAKAGIGIGVAAAAVIGLLVGWLLLGRSKSRTPPVQEPESSPGAWKPELSAESRLRPPQQHYELSGENPKYEVHS